MKVKKSRRATETEMVKPVLNAKSKTKFKKETGKAKKGVAASPSSTLTSELLLSSKNTPGARADRLAQAKARRAKKGKDPKKGRPAVAAAEKKGKKASPAAAAAAAVVPVVVDEITRAKLEEAKAKRIAKKLRQKAEKKNRVTETGNGAGNGTAAAAATTATAKTKKKKKASLPDKIEALQCKFSKQKEKIRLWKLQKKRLGKDGGKSTTTTTTTTTTEEDLEKLLRSSTKTSAAELAKVAKEEKHRMRNAKKKRRLARRKAEGVKIYKNKPRKGRTAATAGMEVA